MENNTTLVENGVNNRRQQQNSKWKSNKCCLCLRRNLLTILTVVGVIGGFGLNFILRSSKTEWTEREISYVHFCGDLFLRMLKGLILPLIMSSLISAIGSLDLSMSGKIGGRAVCYYLVTTICAVILGIVLVSIIRPGMGGSVELSEEIKSRNVTTADTLLDLLRNMFAPNLIQACIQQYRTVLKPVENETDLHKWKMSSQYDDGMNILGLVVFSVLLGIALSSLGEAGEGLLKMCHSLSEAMMVITSWVIWISPIGVLFLVTAKLLEIDDFAKIMEQLGLYLVTVLSGLFLHGFIILPLLYYVITRNNPFVYILNMGQAIATAFGTASSSATLPVAIGCLENKNNIDPRVARFVMPIGATINMDGTALYEAVAALFIAQVRNVPLSFGSIIAVSITATAASIGAAGIPQAGLVTMVMVLDTVGLPAQDVSLIIAVDWLLCSHSELPRVLEGLKALGHYLQYPIDELIIENNNIPALPGRAFFPVKVMRLMLRNNGLERVSNDWLSGLETTLMELYIVEPMLRSLPEDSVNQIHALEAITIQTELMKRLPKFSGLPKLRHLQIVSSSLVELSPRHFRMLPALEKFQVSGSQRLVRLENSFLQDLPRLNTVNISYCGISLIHPRTFSRLPLLTELILVGNKISDAGMIGRGIRDLPSLSVLRLDYNTLDKLEEASFVDLPSLKNLYLSNNRITDLQRTVFHRVPLLRTIDLNYNIIRRIHPETFLQHSGNRIEQLWMIDNDISHISEIRSVLDALPRLLFLDVSNNQLQSIPYGALRGHPTLERLHLDHNKIHKVEREAFSGMPALRELRLRNNSLSNLLDAPLWNLPALKGLDLSQNYFRRLEPRLLSNLPSLRRIDFSANLLTSVDPATFLNTPALEHVNVSHNTLTSLHPATFRHLMNLYELDASFNKLLEFIPGLPRGIEYLHIAKNQITSIPVAPSPDLDLPALRMLDLSLNNIHRIVSGSMRSLPQLKKLYVDGNEIQQLEDGSFEGLTLLEDLSLSENKIKNIQPHTFREMTDIRKLNLRENQLEILRPELFRNARNLKILDLSNNRLTEIMSGTLDTTKDLVALDASNNLLTELPAAFDGLKHLTILDLTNNKIRHLDPGTLGSLLALSELRISRNLIRELRRSAFENLQNLEVLYLDNNELEMIETNALRSLPMLSIVKINRNNIRDIPDGALVDLPSLQMAELQENRIKSISGNAFYRVPHLLFLNLSHNELTGLEEAGLRNLRSLEVLDLSNNKMTRVTSFNLENMEWLVELKMDNNDICGVHGSAFNDMPRLKVLSMRNNKLMTLPENAVKKLRGNIAILDIDGNPLLCSCNLLWMRAWIQEAGLVGPRCSDGTLLREMRLSRQDCFYEQNPSDLVAPGCEAELLSVPSYGTSQVFSHWMDIKEKTTPSTLSLNPNMAPSPEESEYFYDEYIDYPYNDSNTSSQNLSYSVQKKKEVSTTVASTTQNISSHYIPGDTPVIYAGTNKTKTKLLSNNTKTTIPSPSSSGFTFFGVPLPSLNLNSLWPGSGKPMTPANRKTDNVRNRVANGRVGNFFPPTQPEIETGGFVPIIPGASGGFRPIVNPLHFNFTTTTERPLANITPTSKSNTTTILPSSMLTDVTEDFLARRGTYLGHPIPPPTVAPMSTTPTSSNITLEITKSSTITLDSDIVNSSTSNLVQHTTILNTEKEETTLCPTTETINLNITQSTKLDENDTSTVNAKLSGNTTLTPTVVLELETASGIDSFEDLFQEIIENVSVPYIPSTIPSTTSKNVPSNLPNIDQKETAFASNLEQYLPKTNKTKSNDGPSTLSTFLIPGGLQPPYRPSIGRSTITKVISPHVSTASLHSSHDHKEETLSTILPTNKTKPNVSTFTSSATSQIPPHDRSMSWYFINYNKTNLQPYIDPAIKLLSGSGQVSSSAFFVSILMVLREIILT